MIRIITGRAGVGKTTLIQKEIAETLKASPIGEPIIVIVPDQQSYSMEYDLTTKYDLGGLIRAEVLTFKRLAWRILQQEGGITRQEIDQYGYSMLLRSILEEERERLQLFQNVATRQGFIDQLTRMLQEFERYRIDYEALARLEEEMVAKKMNETLIRKIKDLRLIAERVEGHIGTQYVDSERYLRMLAEAIPHSAHLKNATIYIDGFEDFTEREMEIIEGLVLNSQSVTFSVQVDLAKEYSDVFLQGRKMYDKLQLLLERNHLNIEEQVTLTDMHRTNKRALRHVERMFDTHHVTPIEADDSLTIIEAEDQQAEIDAVAREIIRQVKEGKRYRDIAIMYRQSELYDDLLRQRLSHYGIPFFLSMKKPMLHHPLIELTRSVLDIVKSNWAYEPMMRALKTELFYPVDEPLERWRMSGEQFENFVLMRGIVGKRWFDEERWTYIQYRGLESIGRKQTDEELQKEALIQEMRDRMCTPLAIFEAKVKGKQRGRVIITALFELMEQLNVFEHLMRLREVEMENGSLEKASEHEQAWRKWVHVLEQFDMMFGEREMTIREAIPILDEGLETLTFSQIPPAVDQVTITTFETSSISNPDLLYVIGVNDGVIPARMDYEGLLSDREREFFESVGYPLALSTTEQLERETYYLYRALTAAREKVTITYAVADDEGKALLPSMFIEQLKQMVHDIPVQYVVNDVSELQEEAEKYVVTLSTSLTYFIQQWRVAEYDVQKMPMFWRYVYEQLKKDPFIHVILRRMMERTVSRNKEKYLHPDMTKQLYGEKFVSSVSRIESFYNCPFQHFASYGLQLKERTQFTLEPPQLGDLFHAALKYVHEEIKRRQLAWHEIDHALSAELAHEALQQLAPYFVHQILLSSSRYTYIMRKLTSLVEQTVGALGTQARRSMFQPVKVEAGFGPGEGYDMPPLLIRLQHDVEMELRGRIDRIDALEKEDKTYIRIVDYKSSAQQLDLSAVYYGLSLQMLTYLEAAVVHAPIWYEKEVHPAGMLYFHVHNPLIKADDLKEDQITAEKIASYQMKGYVTNELSILQAMDEVLKEKGAKSQVVPAQLTQAGKLNAHSKVLTEDDMYVLMDHVSKKHEQAGNQMIEGDTRVYPYMYDGKKPCTFCNYRSVCQYDETDPAYDRRDLTKLNEKVALERMRGERLK